MLLVDINECYLLNVIGRYQQYLVLFVKCYW